MELQKGLAIAAIAVLTGLLGLFLAVYGRELIKHVLPASATVKVPGSGVTITAYEPVLVGEYRRTTRLIFALDDSVLPAEFSAMGDLVGTPNIGVYVDQAGTVFAAGTWETKQISSDGRSIVDRGWTYIDTRECCDKHYGWFVPWDGLSTKVNRDLCAPQGLTPSRFVEGACYIGSFNFDGASNHRMGGRWDSDKWSFEFASERPEFFDDIGG